jgi:hypothetical protein
MISGMIAVFAIITLKYYHDDEYNLGKCSMVLIRLTETSVRNIAYDSKIFIESDIRSPDSTGRRNTNGLKRQNSSVGIIIVTI